MACIQNINHNAEEDDSSIDWQLPTSFVKKRHTEKIEGACAITDMANERTGKGIQMLCY